MNVDWIINYSVTERQLIFLKKLTCWKYGHVGDTKSHVIYILDNKIYKKKSIC